MLSFSDWNKEGLIPGPDEKEEDFFKRARYCLDLKQELAKVEAELPFTFESQGSPSILLEGFKKTKELFGIQPSWIPLFFSNYQLAPWHGGCAWIFQMGNETPTAAFLQLRKQFQNQSTYLKVYQRSELVAHEISHIGRMMYQEPQFEEIFAYQTDSSPWRKWWGPIVQTSRESLLFVLLLGGLIFADIALLTSGSTNAYHWALWLTLIPLGIVGLAATRLFQRHRQLKKCLNHLVPFFEDPLQRNHFAYRLTDQEIQSFAQMESSQIRNYIEKEKNNSFRWQFLNEVYFKK